MRNRSVLSEARQIRLASQLIRLGARLQLLESETSLSRERLIRLYKEIMGVSPPKGMLPYSVDWFTSWRPSIHSSLFINIHRFLVTHTESRNIEALLKSYELYLEHIRVHGMEPVLTLTRAWTLVRFIEKKLLREVVCTRCGGSFIVNALDLCSGFVCGLCHVPSRAGKTGKASMRCASA
jgi:flagellar transcriptional activator FlhC